MTQRNKLLITILCLTVILCTIISGTIAWLSQAVQATGFGNATDALNAAFPYGTNNENVAGWFNP